jgi:hypothetical protein
MPSFSLTRRLAFALPILALLLSVAMRPAQAQIYALPHADTSQSSSFGIAVALDSARAIVGASGEATCGPNGGAAYVYEREGGAGTWQQTARLIPTRSQCQEGAFFGQALDLSGNRAIVSASSDFFAERRSNAAYIFERDSLGDWNQVARLTAETEYDEGSFAADVSIDGDRALVTTSGNPDGDRGGAAYLFERNPETEAWQQVARLTTQDGVEHGVLGGAGELDGDRVVVAASTYFKSKAGSVYVFERDTTGTWTEAARIGGVDDFFISVTLNGDHVLIGEAFAGDDESGAASVYRRTASGTWTREATLLPSTPYASGAFGSAVSLFDGRALVTGYDEQLGQDFNIDRVVYVFDRDPADGSWSQQQIIDIGEVDFGTALDQNAAFGLISSVPDDKPGTVYVVRLF